VIVVVPAVGPVTVLVVAGRGVRESVANWVIVPSEEAAEEDVTALEETTVTCSVGFPSAPVTTSVPAVSPVTVFVVTGVVMSGAGVSEVKGVTLPSRWMEGSTVTLSVE
jgi:hypothetical protein